MKKDVQQYLVVVKEWKYNMLSILLLFGLMACTSKVKKVKNEKEILVDSIRVLIKTESEIIDTTIHAVQKANTLSFKEVLNTLKIKTVPLLEATNFDGFIEEDDYSEVSANAFQLDKIYTDYFEKDSEYRAIRNFKLKLSDNFYSVVLTVNDGDLEMETFLINYTLQGEIIAFKRIAYDNVLNASSRTTSIIKNNRLTIYTVDTEKEKQETSEVFQIKENGKFMWLHNQASLLSNVIQQLNLEKEKVKTNLLVTKVMPGNPLLTIMVIPEIAYVDEDEQHFELNSYIVLVDNETGIIKNQYFESYRSNGWTSDAISMSKITLDTAPYMIAEDTRAFGIRVHYVGQSSVNPYNKETLSLFVKSGDSLNKVLHNLAVTSYSGFWDSDCTGVFKDVKSLIIMTKEKTDNYYNIEVKSKITETSNYINETADCISKDAISTSRMILKYNNKTYR